MIKTCLLVVGSQRVKRVGCDSNFNTNDLSTNSYNFFMTIMNQYLLKLVAHNLNKSFLSQLSDVQLKLLMK